MSEECTHSNWMVESSSCRTMTYGGVTQDFITFYVVCECGQDGELTRIVQELADEFSTVYWGPTGRLTLVVSSR